MKKAKTCLSEQCSALQCSVMHCIVMHSTSMYNALNNELCYSADNECKNNNAEQIVRADKKIN